MCLYPITLAEGSSLERVVPCGQCIECEAQKSTEWAFRVMLESKDKDACFLTLTYNDENLPKNQSVEKSAVQKFIKRFRKNYPDIAIKYFACGEYGEKFARPHYHIIIIGYTFDDVTFWDKSKSGEDLFRSAKLEKLWTFGFSYIEDVTLQSAKYVAKYLQKALFPKAERYVDDAIDRLLLGRNYYTFQELYGIEPPFVLMSKGLGYTNWNKDIITGKIYIDGRYIKVPRYFLDRFEKENACELVELRQRRIETSVFNKKTYDEIKQHRDFVLKRLTKYLTV